MRLSRRGLLGFSMAAPAIVAASSLMPISTLVLPRKRLILNAAVTLYVRPDGADGAFRSVKDALSYVQRSVHLNGHEAILHIPYDRNWFTGVTRPIA